jgi:hypothetical protein
MKAAKTITNSYHDFRILNVSKSTRHPKRRGPFMAIQKGSDPNDPQMRECTFVLTRRGTWMHCYLFLLLPGRCDVRQQCSTRHRISSRWRKNSRKSLLPSRLPCRCTTSSAAMCRHWQATTIRRARRYWPSYASGSKVWLARRADLGWQPNAHEKGVLQQERAVSDTGSPCGYGGRTQENNSGSLYEMAWSFRTVQNFRRRVLVPCAKSL